MFSNKKAIAVFDSGVGGLTVLRELINLLPQENFLYVGDTARVPYGAKSAESVRRFSIEVARFLKRKNVKLMVTACNTVSALALADLRRFMPTPVLGVIEPGARAALAATRSKRVGLIGTTATVQSGAYEKAISRLDPTIKVFGRACPLFVPLVEEGWADHPITRRVAEIYLKPLLENKIDTIVLGCTHYPLIRKTIKRVARRVELIDSARETAKAVRSRLEQDGLLLHGRRRGNIECYSSDDPLQFSRIGRRFLGSPLGPVYRLRLDGVDKP